MASKLVISCDQCGKQTTNDDPHAHPGLSGIVPKGWTEVRLTTTEPVPVRRGFPRPAWLEAREPDVIDAEFEPEPHEHLSPVAKSALLCADCAGALVVLVGDVAPKWVTEGGGYSIVGPRGLVGRPVR